MKKYKFVFVFLVLGLLISPLITKAYVFQSNLNIGSKGTDVMELQNILIQKGLIVGKADGVFGNQTLLGVQKLQIANGFTSTSGAFGPKTRALLSTSTTNIPTPIPTPTNIANCILNISLSSSSPVNQVVSVGTNNVTIAKYNFTAQGCNISVPEIISGNYQSGDDVGCNNYRAVTSDNVTKPFTDFSNNFGENTYIAGFPTYENTENFIIPNGGTKTVSVIANAVSTGVPGSSYGICSSSLTSMIALNNNIGSYNIKIGNLPIINPITKVQ